MENQDINLRERKNEEQIANSEGNVDGLALVDHKMKMQIRLWIMKILN